MWDRNSVWCTKEPKKKIIEDYAPTPLVSCCKCFKTPLSISVCRNPLEVPQGFNHRPINEDWTLTFTFQAKKRIMSGIFPSIFSYPLRLPSFLPLSIFWETQTVLFFFFFFCAGGKQVQLSHQGRAACVHWSDTFWLISPLYPLCSFLSFPSLSSTSIEIYRKSLIMSCMLFTNSKLKFGRLKYFLLNVCFDCGKSRNLRKYLLAFEEMRQRI